MIHKCRCLYLAFQIDLAGCSWQNFYKYWYGPIGKISSSSNEWFWKTSRTETRWWSKYSSSINSCWNCRFVTFRYSGPWLYRGKYRPISLPETGGPIRPKRPFGQNWSVAHLSDCSLSIGPEWSRVKCTETETLQGGRQAALQLYFGILSLLMKRLSIQLEQKMQILPKGNVLVIGDSIIRWLFSRITWL